MCYKQICLSVCWEHMHLVISIRDFHVMLKAEIRNGSLKVSAWWHYIALSGFIEMIMLLANKALYEHNKEILLLLNNTHMLCYAVLCCAVLCCAVLCCAVLFCSVLCCALLICALLCWTVLWCTNLCCMYWSVLSGTHLCCAVLFCAVKLYICVYNSHKLLYKSQNLMFCLHVLISVYLEIIAYKDCPANMVL